MNKKIVADLLRRQTIISEKELNFERLKGGVSSDIFKVSDGNKSVVVKQALPKLNVEDDWYADISRNENEQKFIQFLQQFRPQSIPKLLYSNREHSFFVMEYLGSAFKNWKQQMLIGLFDAEIAKRSSELLAAIHEKSCLDDRLKNEFNKADNFFELRTEPYLVTTGERHPDLKDHLFKEVERLNHHQETIVHGDFSPKNILSNNERVVLLDHEVAWFGDPAFDLAFFLNHLYLKMLYHFTEKNVIQDLTMIAWNTYFGNRENQAGEEMKVRTIRLLLMLMLARIDGKSPVEYLQSDQQDFVRSFVDRHLTLQNFSHKAVNEKWKEQLRKEFNEDKRD